MSNDSTQLEPHDYEIGEVGGFVVIRIKREIHSQMDFGWLRRLFEESCAAGKSRIAVAFDKNSYLYSRIITALVASSKVVKACGGELAVVDPGKYVLGTLDTMKLRDSIISVYRSENDLRAGNRL